MRYKNHKNSTRDIDSAEDTLYGSLRNGEGVMRVTFSAADKATPLDALHERVLAAVRETSTPEADSPVFRAEIVDENVLDTGHLSAVDVTAESDTVVIFDEVIDRIEEVDGIVDVEVDIRTKIDRATLTSNDS